MRAVFGGCVGLFGLLVVVASVQGSAGRGEQCTAGSSWYRECNLCWCTDGFPACTLKGCFPGRSYPELRCKDGSRWMRHDCNWCSCMDGAAVCTYRACLPDWARERSPQHAVQQTVDEPGELAEQTCNPGTEADRWREGCNWCSCLPTGAKDCTRRGCPAAIVQRLEGTKECEGEASWKRSCNWCNCVNGGAACTKMRCMETEPPAADSGVASTEELSEEEEPNCRVDHPADRWRDGCNWCRCLKGRAACTKRGCPPALLERLQHEGDCEGSPRWKKDCNWCSCAGGKGVCTKRACAPKRVPPEVEDGNECTDGSSWTESCNSCYCSRGAAACSLRACATEVANTCQEGSLWKSDDCNWCSCTSDGRPTCTRRFCPGGAATVIPHDEDDSTESSEDSYSPGGSLTNGASCTPGSRWKMDGCNWCTCVSGGGSCTQIFCPGLAAVSNKLECIDGSSWSDGCNDCTCSNGKSLCTRKFCLADNISTHRDPNSEAASSRAPPRAPGAVVPPSVRPHISLGGGGHGTQVPAMSLPRDDRDCIPGSRFSLDGCNWCSCTDAGVAVCTLMSCIRPRIDLSNMCDDGSRWKKDCNWCNCIEGRGVCTRMGCLPAILLREPPVDALVEEPEEELAADAECMEGSRWRSDCNWCSCQGGRGRCTLMACLPGVTEEGPQCEAGSRWKSDCNWCQCTKAGVGVCTLRACFTRRPQALVEDPRESPADAECTEGSRWKKDCNWCNCGNGRGSCTKKACRPGRTEEGPQCEAGARWKRDCNWCECSEAGVATCTRMGCFTRRPLPYRVPVAQLPVDESQGGAAEEPAADAECTEGSRWKKDCNWCNCRNGRGLCTKRACIPGRTEEGPQCEAGARWKRDCNWCQCSETGVAACTLKGCFARRPPPASPMSPSLYAGVPVGGGRSIDTVPLQGALTFDKECEPGSRFRIRCNWCSCSRDGRKLCTRKFCNPNEDHSGEPECEGAAVFKDEQNCNWCHCHDGHVGCTEKLCVDSPVRPVAVRGYSFAARRAEEQPRPQQENPGENPPPECVEGNSWVQDCNQCHCRNGLKICTRKMCFTHRVPPPAVTAEGSPAPGGENRCLKPVDSGPCFASFRMFRFNSDNNRCEPFLYGGCAGNDNRFATPELCNQTCGGDAPVMDSMCDRTQCPEYRETGYRAVLGCSPVYEGGSCCATGYFCAAERAVSASEDQCEYHGELYSMGDQVPVTDACSVCHCGFGGRMSCISVECPSLFSRRAPGCRPLYRVGECCEYKEECTPLVLGQAPEPEAPGVTCESEGKSYREGDKMYFDNSGCRRCVCGANYTGPYGAGCTTIDCGYDFRYLERIQRGCVPLYYKERCCPITFICPDDSRIAGDQSQANPEGLTEDVCSFNGQSVAIGHELATVEEKLTCSCRTPPSVTCVQTSN